MIERLEAYRKENGLNQRQLAGLMGISESHLSRVLSGKKKPGSKMVEQYFQLPGVREKEAIAQVRELIDDLWLAGEIEGKPARKILETLKNPQE